jgi:hypothetical protein
MVSTRPSGRGPSESEHDVVDRFPHRREVAEVLVVDREPHGPLPELLLERLDQLDERERVGVEVVRERGVQRDAGVVDLEDLRQVRADHPEHLVLGDGLVGRVGLSRHAWPPVPRPPA